MSVYFDRLVKYQTENLHRACHGVERARERWASRRETGLTDAELITAFNSEAGNSYYGSSGGHGMFHCRPGSFHWESGGSGPCVLKGPALVRELRIALEIGMPVDVNQPTLF